MRDDPERRLRVADGNGLAGDEPDPRAIVAHTTEREEDAGLLFWFCVAVLAIGFFLLLANKLWAQAPGCRGWISETCCCTNGACHNVAPGEVIRTGDNEYFIPATGEKRARTGWSKDGTFVRCSYASKPNGGWLIGPQYPTSCLYTPPPTS